MTTLSVIDANTGEIVEVDTLNPTGTLYVLDYNTGDPVEIDLANPSGSLHVIDVDTGDIVELDLANLSGTIHVFDSNTGGIVEVDLSNPSGLVYVNDANTGDNVQLDLEVDQVIPFGHSGALVVVMGGGVQYGEEQTLALQPDGTAGLDTYLRSDQATSNLGTITALFIGEYQGIDSNMRGLIKFDLSSIPANALVVSATLSLMLGGVAGATDPATLSVYRLKRAWVESQATWNIYSTGNNWATAGGFGADDCEQESIGAFPEVTTLTTINEFKDASLTPAKVQEWISGAFANNGMMLKNSVELNNNYTWRSSDFTTAEHRPKIEVVYQVPL